MSTQELSPQTKSFLEAHLKALNEKKNLSGGNDQTLNSALLYEKIRSAFEYQEDQWVFKNAIARILRRKFTLTPNISTDHLYLDLVNELSWANYINPETIEKKEEAALKITIEKYLYILKSAKSSQLREMELQKFIIDLAACQISNILIPNQDIDLLTDFAYQIINQDISLEDSNVNLKENEIQLQLAIRTLLYKPDNAVLNYWLLTKMFPEWNMQSPEDTQSFALQFDRFYNKINSALNHPYRKRYFQYVRKNIPPFILIRNMEFNPKTDYFKSNAFNRLALETYDKLTTQTAEKVWRGTYRTLIFIFISKISLAFLLEIPFDRISRGRIDVLPLVINIFLPPILMLLAGSFIKAPPEKNRIIISKTLSNITATNKIEQKIFYIKEQPLGKLNAFFNLIYGLFSLAILFAVIWSLVKIGFNPLSIILFLIFVSAISFFSFRIRNIALEFAMVRTKDSILISSIEFLFLPFIRLGKIISDLFTRSNPIILTLDFLIEAPFKTILKISNRWFHFVRAKKEEIEY